MSLKTEPQTADLNPDGKAASAPEPEPAVEQPGHPQPADKDKKPEPEADAVDRAGTAWNPASRGCTSPPRKSGSWPRSSSSFAT